jgi:hypothetical protein
MMMMMMLLQMSEVLGCVVVFRVMLQLAEGERCCEWLHHKSMMAIARETSISFSWVERTTPQQRECKYVSVLHSRAVTDYRWHGSSEKGLGHYEDQSRIRKTH